MAPTRFGQVRGNPARLPWPTVPEMMSDNSFKAVSNQVRTVFRRKLRSTSQSRTFSPLWYLNGEIFGVC